MRATFNGWLTMIALVIFIGLMALIVGCVNDKADTTDKKDNDTVVEEKKDEEIEYKNISLTVNGPDWNLTMENHMTKEKSLGDLLIWEDLITADKKGQITEFHCVDDDGKVRKAKGDKTKIYLDGELVKTDLFEIPIAESSEIKIVVEK